MQTETDVTLTLDDLRVIRWALIRAETADEEQEKRANSAFDKVAAAIRAHWSWAQ